MPSDLPAPREIDVLAPSIARFGAAVAATLEQVRGTLLAGESDVAARADRLRAQLGPFASARIDSARLAAAIEDRRAPDAAGLRRLSAARAVLDEIVARDGALYELTVPPGGDLAAAVTDRLAVLGRAFAAARLATAARRGATPNLDEEAALQRFPFSAWSTAERRLAPPLLVHVQGTDLSVASLASLLDGAIQILLIVNGPCAPAPLVRLVTPGVLVIQAHEPDDLEPMSRCSGAAIGALMGAMAARFVHDPAAPGPAPRLSIRSRPSGRLSRVGGFTVAQQQEELRQLDAIAAASAAGASAAEDAPTEAAAEPAERLAAWLLRQADLPARAPGE